MKSLPNVYGFVALQLVIFSTILTAQVPFDSSAYRYGYDIPLGMNHGTWDFDEWPGIDHTAVYKEKFRYNTEDGDKIKIDYSRTAFDEDDHTGYLRTPKILDGAGFKRISELLPSLNPKSIVGIFAHPDDEILLAGGLFAAAAALGWDVKIYLVSNGADGSAGTSAGPVDALGGYNSFGIMPNGSVRVLSDKAGIEKARIASRYAGIIKAKSAIIEVNLELDGKRVVQLGEVAELDWERSFGPASKARSAMKDAIGEILRKERPSIVVTHGTDGEYGNYLHKTVHQVVVSEARLLPGKPMLFTAFPEYNIHDRITHYIDLDVNNRYARELKYRAFKAITFLHTPGMDYDKPWDPADALMDGAFVKDYGYTPIEGYPPRYEFYQLIPDGER